MSQVTCPELMPGILGKLWGLEAGLTHTWASHFWDPPHWQGGVAVGSYLGLHLCPPWAPAPCCVPGLAVLTSPRWGCLWGP